MITSEFLLWSGWLVALILGALWWRERREVRQRRRGAIGAIGALRALQTRDYERARALAKKYLPGEYEFHLEANAASNGARKIGSRVHGDGVRPLGAVEESEVAVLASQNASLQSVATAFQHTVYQLEARDHDAQIARRELEDVLASLQDSVLVVDDEARLRFLNAAAQKFFAVRAEDVLGAHILEALPSFGLEAVIGDALRDGRDHAREVSLYGASDEDSGMTQRREVLLRVAPVRRADGNISGAVAIVQDLTELRAIGARAARFCRQRQPRIAHADCQHSRRRRNRFGGRRRPDFGASLFAALSRRSRTFVAFGERFIGFGARRFQSGNAQRAR